MFAWAWPLLSQLSKAVDCLCAHFDSRFPTLATLGLATACSAGAKTVEEKVYPTPTIRM